MIDQVKKSKDKSPLTTVIEEGLLPGKKMNPDDKLVTLAGEDAEQPNQEQKKEE